MHVMDHHGWKQQPAQWLQMTAASGMTQFPLQVALKRLCAVVELVKPVPHLHLLLRPALTPGLMLPLSPLPTRQMPVSK
jgi:hypothetical protein